MQLCFFLKLPLLAVKTFLHIRKYKLDISPITYSFYNKALIETDNWPTFDQDKWGKIRLIWLVVGKFRQNLRIKAERELKAKAKNDMKFKRKKIKKKLKNSKILVDDNATPNFRQNKLDMRNLDKKPENLIFKSPKINQKYCSVIFLDSAGLIFSKQKHQDKLNINRKFLSISSNLDKLNIRIDFKNENSNQIRDPLGALLNDSVKKKVVLSTENEDVKKRLFDYRPFENKTVFYDQIKDSTNNQNISYDSELYSDDDYDGSSEQDLPSNESIDFESGSDFEVDSDHFNLKNDQECDKLSQSKISLDLRNSCITPKQNSNNGFVTPFFSGFVKKLENSIELSGSKLKTACQIVTDKSMEFKDALISSSSQNEIASKVRSFSSYNFKTKQYINHFVKSTSNFSIKKNSVNESYNNNNDRNDRANGFKKMHEMFNLEPLLTDEKFESKNLSWWKIDQKLNHFCDLKSRIRLLDVQMSTCNL